MAIDPAAQSQSAIGWPNLFRGLISDKWGRITDSTAASCHSRLERIRQATSYLAGIIGALQDYSLATIWKSRNDVLHQNAELSNAILLAQLHHEITAMYSIRDTFSPIIQSYFSKPLDDRLLCSLRQNMQQVGYELVYLEPRLSSFINASQLQEMKFDLKAATDLCDRQHEKLQQRKPTPLTASAPPLFLSEGNALWKRKGATDRDFKCETTRRRIFTI